MFFTVRQTTNEALIRKLHEKCFPGEDFYENKKNNYWVVMDRHANPIGFGIATDFGHGICFLSRAGVVAKYRGHGIHKKLISTRIGYYRRRSFNSIVTYTTKDNHASINNLVARGFKSFSPEYAWVGNEFLYWILEI
jgi:ribosomal protein S18 acetylase RimI-like enzyme